MSDEFYYYNINLVLHKPLHDKEIERIWDLIIYDMDPKLATGGSREVSKDQWKRIVRIVNEARS